MRPGLRQGSIVFAAVALALVLVAGCGGSDESDAADVAKDYLTATIGGEGAAACELLSEDARAFLETSAPAEIAGEGASCDEIISATGAEVSEEQVDLGKELISDIDEEDVTIDGDTAEVGLTAATGVPMRLERDGDSWLITQESLQGSVGQNAP
ncbi:MAG: hypothetical protein QOI31_1678 [Solirubrobacterales bacterium]|nr:hypothetical protein [Solirubrobacterales bacterium]